MSSKSRTKGRPPQLSVTKRDYEILKTFVGENFISVPEIHSKHFKDLPRKAVWNRMKKLSSAGLLREYRGDLGALLGWYVPRSGRRPPVYKTSFDHDMKVREVVSVFEKTPAFRSWCPAFAISGEIMRDTWRDSPEEKRQKGLEIPDGELELKIDGRRVKYALEVELTRKSLTRLYDKMEKLLLSKRYPVTFYVVRGRTLLRLLRRVEAHVLRSSFRLKLCDEPREIYYCELSEFEKEGIHAKFESRFNTLALEKITA